MEDLPHARWDLAGAVSQNQIKQYHLYAWSDQAGDEVLTTYDRTPIATHPSWS